MERLRARFKAFERELTYPGDDPSDRGCPRCWWVAGRERRDALTGAGADGHGRAVGSGGDAERRGLCVLRRGGQVSVPGDDMCVNSLRDHER